VCPVRGPAPPASDRRGAKLFQAFPRISKYFQGNSKEIPRKFQGNSKEIPNFSKYFQTFSLAVSSEFKGLLNRRAGIAFSPTYFVVPAATSGPAIACRTRARFKIARTPIAGKKLSAAICPRSLAASAASHAPTRKPTAATPAQLGQRAPSTSRKRFLAKPRGGQRGEARPRRLAESAPLTASWLRKSQLPRRRRLSVRRRGGSGREIVQFASCPRDP